MTGPCEAPTLSLTEQMTLEPRRVVSKVSLMLDPAIRVWRRPGLGPGRLPDWPAPTALLF